jgi:hypothetical protein
MQLTPSFRSLLQPFRSVFTAPSFRLFVLILTGWLLSCRHRFITEGIFTAGQVGIGHWSCFHRFFSPYAWSLDNLCRVLTGLLLRRFAATGPILLAADDTLCRKRGLGLFGAGMDHDPLFSSKALKVFSWGHDWVVLALLVRLPRWAPTKVFALPLLFRLYVNVQGLAKGKKKKTKKTAAAGPKKKWRRPQGSNHRTRPELPVGSPNARSSFVPTVLTRAKVCCNRYPATSTSSAKFTPKECCTRRRRPKSRASVARHARRASGCPTCKAGRTIATACGKS